MLLHPVLALRLLLLACIALFSLNAASALEPVPASSVTVCHADDPTCATPVIVKPLVQDTCLVPSFLPGAVLYSCSGLVATAHYFASGVASDCSPDNTSQATAVSFGPFDGSAPISVSAGGVQYEYLRINCYAAQQASSELSSLPLPRVRPRSYAAQYAVPPCRPATAEAKTRSRPVTSRLA